MDQKYTDLTFDEIRTFSETAGDFKRLWLSGGEPSLREDLPEIIEMFYKNNHIKDVNFPSNGIKTERLIEWFTRLRKSCPDCNIAISISLDGFGDVHDTQRGVPCFYKTIETIKRFDEEFKDDGHVLRNVATVITKFNVDQILDLMLWVYGRFKVTTHTIEAARGNTREDGVKIVTEASLRKLQDQMIPYYVAYSKRIAAGVDSSIGKKITNFFYQGLMRTLYNIRASNIDHPCCWNMDCTAGETSLVLDYDGRFRACELREPVGKMQDYDFDAQKMLFGSAMKSEIATIGHGYKANCWCTHGCWIMSSLNFNPIKMLSQLFKANKEIKKLDKPLPPLDESVLKALEAKYGLDPQKLPQW
jgi:sulfatase maturation enzyme AslB (radical SAM superfamily)